MKSSQDLLSMYQNGLGSEERWLVQTQQQVATQPPLSGDVTDAKVQLQPTMVSVKLWIPSATDRTLCETQ